MITRFTKGSACLVALFVKHVFIGLLRQLQPSGTEFENL